MEFMETLEKRKSVKSFTEKEISDDTIKKMLKAASLSPSWQNHQCWKLLIIRDKETKEKIAASLSEANTAKAGVIEAPILIAICAEPHKSNKVNEKDYYLVDSAIAMEHLILAATNEGLGTCWIGAFDEDQVRSILNVPAEYKIVALTPVGYTKTESDSEPRRELIDIAYSEKWGKVIH